MIKLVFLKTRALLVTKVFYKHFYKTFCKNCSNAIFNVSLRHYHHSTKSSTSSSGITKIHSVFNWRAFFFPFIRQLNDFLPRPTDRQTDNQLRIITIKYLLFCTDRHSKIHRHTIKTAMWCVTSVRRHNKKQMMMMDISIVIIIIIR